jgi:cobalt-zinc-cadmium efflux system outer membrane protein
MRFLFLIAIVLANTLTQAQISLSLQEALSLAVKNNPNYKAEKYTLDMAKTAITTAGLHLNPSVSFGTEVVPSSKYYAPGTGFLAPENRQMTFQLSKVFQVGGQLKYKIEAAKSDLVIAGVNLSQFEWNLLSEVASKWLDVWYADEKLNLITQAKSNSDTLLRVNQIRLRNQVITTTEFSRTQINEEQYKLMQLSALQLLKSERNNLALLLGISDSIKIDKNELWFPVALPLNYDSLLQIAIANRKELQLSKSMTDKAKIDLSLQQAIAKPQPEVGFNYSPQNRVPYLGVSVAIPLPFSDRNQGEIARAKIAATQADAIRSAYLMQVTKEVRNAYDEFNTNKNNWDKYLELNKQSEVVLQSVKMSYLKGGTTILDYLEAERTWYEMQNQFYDAKYNYRKSYLQLLFTCNYTQK